ncbi:RNase P/RNase MRP subunit p29 [Cenarchaeum symbiosum A]|uniref:Ribonuclease P protein component 1 n=1 Tax=Cenarchaeum symbiosum (strain A) TaxID=414004 RepID=A0RVY1_CENSY|nr:RNase P/RNase MRP subunit p29 [Cenarchaeum symbiosum A]
MITQENIRLHELVGLAASASGYIREGMVIDETKNMILLDTAAGRIMLPKAGRLWRFASGRTSCTVQGESLAGRPHERLKR